MTVLKSILCVWACLQLVLPGCLCQLLEPLGIHVPHHHHQHGTFIKTENPGPCRLTAPPAEGTQPEVPCHCDERPDRTTDESLASTVPEVPTVEDSRREILPAWDYQPDPSAALATQLPARGPPHDGTGSAEESRIARCVHLL